MPHQPWDLQSSVEWALGNEALADDLIPFTFVDGGGSGSVGGAVHANVSSFLGFTVYGTVRVTNHAGDSCTQSSWGVRIVSEWNSSRSPTASVDSGARAMTSSLSEIQ